MFDKEKAIAEWRAKLASTGSLFEGDLDELESHLRDELEGLEEVDLRGRAAFDTAVKRLGDVATIGVEFAKVNPLLVWRTALFWLATGCFITLVASPVYDIVMHGVINAVMTLHLSVAAAKATLWICTFAIPIAFYTLLFRIVSQRIGRSFTSLDSPIGRIAFVVAGAASMLAGVALPIPLFGLSFAFWGGEVSPASGFFMPNWDFASIYASYQSAHQMLGGLIVIGACALAITLRQRAIRQASTTRTSGDAPLFWLSVGTFIALVRQDLGGVVREAALTIGWKTHLSFEQITPLMWILSFGCPLFLAMSAYSFLRFRAPPPTAFLARRGFIVAIVLTCASAALPILTAERPTGDHDFYWASDLARCALHGGGNYTSGAFGESTMANCLTSVMIAFVLGVIIVRLQRSARGDWARGAL